MRLNITICFIELLTPPCASVCIPRSTVSHAFIRKQAQKIVLKSLSQMKYVQEYYAKNIAVSTSLVQLQLPKVSASDKKQSFTACGCF